MFKKSELKSNQSVNALFTSSTEVLISCAVQLLAVLLWIIYWFYPQKANLIMVEDGLVENTQAILLLVAALVFIYIANKMRVLKKYNIAIVGLLFALILFLVFMEEVSWFQRVLEVESSEFFKQNNAQSETNLHNLSTHLFQNIYYFGGFVLFSFLPFFRNSILSLLQRYKRLHLIALTFLPRQWIIIPFAVTSAFMWPTAYLHPTVILSYVLAIAFIAITAYRMVKVKNVNEALLSTTAMILLLVIGYTTLFNWELSNIRSGAPTEYTETFISIGVFIYALDTMIQVIRSEKLPLKPVAKNILVSKKTKI
jgi:hypothetical protein